MQIVLPHEIKSFVEREVASGRYADEQQVIVEALRRLADDEPDDRMTIAEAVAESLAQIERGEVRELTDDVFDDLLKKLEADAEHGVPVRDAVRYQPHHHARRGNGYSGHPSIHHGPLGKVPAQRLFCGAETCRSTSPGVSRDGT